MTQSKNPHSQNFLNSSPHRGVRNLRSFSEERLRSLRNLRNLSEEFLRSFEASSHVIGCGKQSKSSSRFCCGKNPTAAKDSEEYLK